MSMSPPPGWYPDPSVPSTERWWDGAAWTEHRRTPRPPEPPTVPAGFGPAEPTGFGPAQPTGFGPAQPTGFGPAQPYTQPGGRAGRGKALALGLSAVVLVASLITGAVLLTGGGDGDTHTGTREGTPQPTASDDKPIPSPSDSPSPSPQPSDDPSVVVDELNGVTLPVLDGWTKAEFGADDTVLLTTPGTYDCPGEGMLCRHGQVSSSTVISNDTSPKVVAGKDISKAADHFFDHDVLDNRPFNGIASHQQVKAGSVAVAGRAGYMVRWRVKTGVGPGGYMESLVFRSSVGSESLVCVRFAFDAGSHGPPLSDMDKITEGIRSVDDATTGGGVGSSVGPSV